MKCQRVIVGGGGIAGLASASALADRGFDVVVIERDLSRQQLGAAMMLWANANCMLKKLGVWDQVTQRGNEIETVRIADAENRRLVEIPVGQWDRSQNVRSLYIRRRDLHRVLLERAQSRCLLMEGEVTQIESQGERVSVSLRSGETITGDLLIGADGVKSTARGFVRKTQPPRGPVREEGWFGVCDRALKSDVPDTFHLIMGRGQVFGTGCLSDGRYGWFISRFMRAKQYQESSYRHGVYPPDQLIEGFPPLVAEVIHTTGLDAVFYQTRRKRSSAGDWWRDRVVLSGDAVHSMSPLMAQGACMALEDAVTLASLLAESPNAVPAVLKDYQQARSRRLGWVQTHGLWWSACCRARRPGSQALRNTLFRLFGRPLCHQFHGRLMI